jgi:hypothetical protein
VSEEVFETYYDELCNTIPEDYPRSLKTKLRRGVFKHANEYSLNKRLKELFREHEEKLSGVVDYDELDIYEDIVSPRNELTHYDPEGEGNPPNSEDLETISPLLLCLVEVCILSETGFPEDLIAERIPPQYRRDLDQRLVIQSED